VRFGTDALDQALEALSPRVVRARNIALRPRAELPLDQPSRGV